MRNIDLNYRTLLSVTNVLNSQRNLQGLFRAITEQLAKVVRWERAGVTLYCRPLKAGACARRRTCSRASVPMPHETGCVLLI